MDIEKIRTIAKNNGITLVYIAEKVGMTVQNLHRCVKENKIMAGDLEKIANLLNVDVKIFFNQGNYQFLSNDDALSLHEGEEIYLNPKDERIKNLETQLKLKDEIIELLKEKK